MVYTETRNINGKKYYYRVISIRKGSKISKKRVYLGFNLPNSELIEKEKNADRQLMPEKIKMANQEIGKIKQKIIKILKENKIKKAGIFGSYARGEQKKNSDIDILVEINDKKMSLLDIIRLEKYLEEKLGKKIDLVEYSALHHLLKDKVLGEEIRII
ncbi:MAG: nucleotidyltransferase family protein [Nanoarchaeota archaeon]|nr:nucleotidyltransferase family protein [Nanoarchaeota archaeon]